MLVGTLVLGLAAARACPGPDVPVHVATFNIREFPASDVQVEGAFRIIRELDVPIVAVQEITDPAKFVEAAERRLGTHWRAEFGPWQQERRMLLPGVLYDSRRYQLDGALLHGKTRGGNGRPMLEVRLFSREDGEKLRVFVVHLKAGGGDENHDMRREQLEAITPIIRRAVASRDEVVILGDFNSTGLPDRELLEIFARRTALYWATEDLTCTSYWKPDKGKRGCIGSALDHVFTSEPPHDVAARGPCESVGCQPGEQCPIFYDEVSDHCPVTATF